MAKRRVKKRTQAPPPSNGPKKPGDRSPKSMVIRIGASEVGSSVSQLVKDVRTMMEPQTAVRLKERRSNKLRDYTTMAGPLGVSHLLLFSKSASGNTNLRLAVTPRGPTLHFRVEKYSLCKDVHKSQKRPKGAGGGKEHAAPPLLVMNNFSQAQQSTEQTNGDPQQQQIPKQLESLTTTIFQSLFPPINPTTTPLKSIKRILLLDRSPALPSSSPSEGASYSLTLRHYAIETRPAKSSVPKPLRKLDAAEKLAHASQQRRKRGGIPDLGKFNDVSDFLLDPQAADGFTSGSDSEPETDAEVEVLSQGTQKLQRQQRRGRGGEGGEDGEELESKPRQRRREEAAGARVERRGIKLHELGPRLRLRLTKVEEGLCTGKVMWHEYIHKSADEVREQEKVHAKREAEKERRRAEQKANVERKKADKKAKGANGELADEDEDEEMEDGGVAVDADEWDEVDDDIMNEESEDEEEDEEEDEDGVLVDGGERSEDEVG